MHLQNSAPPLSSAFHTLPRNHRQKIKAFWNARASLCHIRYVSRKKNQPIHSLRPLFMHLRLTLLRCMPTPINHCENANV